MTQSTLTRLALMGAAALLASTAMTADARDRSRKLPDLSNELPQALATRGTEALRAGDAEQAIRYLSELVARQPRHGGNQTLLAIAWQLRGERDAQAIDMALAGYDLAARLEPGQFWPSALAGRATFDQGKYDQSLAHFSRAALLRPQDARILAALAASAYMSGDAALAGIAADRAFALDPADTSSLRLAAFAAAAQGNAAAANVRLDRLTAIAPDDAARARVRVAQLVQTAALDTGGATPGSVDTAQPDAATASPDQISLDVAIVLAQNTNRERTGINLLDGLGLQYGTSRQSTRTINRDNAGVNTNGYQRVLTAAISVPQLNYSLNLFNRGGQTYSVVARPQLTAYRGEQSEFFVGRSIKVAVGGVNLGTLEQIDIGIEMKVTPIEITPTGTRVRIETGRSFLTADPAGSFNEALTTFRQKVAATAEIRFGETLLLSGLSETVDDRTFSKTPVLGDIPLIGNAFNERNRTQRRDSVLVLVTPNRPLALPGRPWARSEQVERLATLWTRVIDPMSNADAATAALSRMSIFTRMTRSDVSMQLPDARQAVGEMVAELFAAAPTK